MDKEKSERIQKKLKDSTVGIAGLGGLGSNAAVALARAGIGHLILVDFDKVELSNLGRQYYFQEDIGKFKTDALKQILSKINPDVNISIINLKLEKGNMDEHFKDADVVIEALDNAETKTTFIEEILTKLPGKPLIAASGVSGYYRSFHR